MEASTMMFVVARVKACMFVSAGSGRLKKCRTFQGRVQKKEKIYMHRVRICFICLDQGQHGRLLETF